jgi:hypothetical protein
VFGLDEAAESQQDKKRSACSRILLNRHAGIASHNDRRVQDCPIIAAVQFENLPKINEIN